ncbi:MAG: MBL fold metallo-hydrolase [Deltaproteobacteria bacterium]
MFTEVSRGVYLIEPPNGGKFPHCFCVYIDGEKKTLIDTSCGVENLLALKKRGVDIIINTHFHEDHIYNNSEFRDAVVWAHKLDAAAIRSLEVFINCYGDLLDYRHLWKQFIDDIELRPSPVHRELAGGEILDLGPWQLEVVHTPGHTPGHIVLWEEKYGFLISGDIDLSGFGPWYGHLCSNITDFLASIELCRQMTPRTLISGHKGLIGENIDKRLLAYRDIILTKEEQVLDNLKEPKTFDQLITLQIFYGQRIRLDDLYICFEKLAIYQHLIRLESLGLVSHFGDTYYRI